MFSLELSVIGHPHCKDLRNNTRLELLVLLFSFFAVFPLFPLVDIIPFLKNNDCLEFFNGHFAGSSTEKIIFLAITTEKA
jgi:hypothetical protein